MTYTATKVFTGTNGEILFTFDLGGGGTANIQSEVDGSWVTMEGITSNSSKVVRSFGKDVRVEVTGSVKYEATYQL